MNGGTAKVIAALPVSSANGRLMFHIGRHLQTQSLRGGPCSILYEIPFWPCCRNPVNGRARRLSADP